MPADQTPRKTLILTRSQVEGLVTMAEVIAAVEAAHSDRRIDDPEDMLSAMSGIIARANNRL